MSKIKQSNKQQNSKKYDINVVTKNFYASKFKKDAKMLTIIKANDTKKFHILDAVMIDKNKVKIFSSVLLKIEDAKHTTSKNEKEERKEYYSCSLDAFMNCISSKYNLSLEDVTTYKQQLEACYK